MRREEGRWWSRARRVRLRLVLTLATVFGPLACMDLVGLKAWWEDDHCTRFMAKACDCPAVAAVVEREKRMAVSLFSTSCTIGGCAELTGCHDVSLSRAMRDTQRTTGWTPAKCERMVSAFSCRKVSEEGAVELERLESL